MSGRGKSSKKNATSSGGVSIGLKLVLIISILISVSLGTLTFLVSKFVGADVQLTAEDNNHAITMRNATTTQNELNTIRSNVFLMLDMLNAAGSSGILSRQTSAYFFERNSNVAAIIIPGDKELLNNRFFLSNEIETSLVQDFLSHHQEEITRAEQGESFVLNAATTFKLPILALLYPWRESGREQAVIMFFSSDTLTETYGTVSGGNQSFMINHAGDLLVHADFDLIEAGASMAKLPLVQQMRENNDENRQILFTDENGVEYFGSYCKLSIADVGVITMIQKSTALKAVTRQTQQNIYLTFGILFISVLFIWIFSKSISNPLKKLRDVAEEIKIGNFNTELFEKLKYRHLRDEIGILVQATKDERDILNTISRLTNKGVAKAVVTKAIDFEPHLKDITIFFSDIRGFTAISDGFNKRFGEKSAGEIISFLNEYMSLMVNCITITGGNVDKFEGDAIMACWGVLRDDDLSFEQMEDGPEKQELALKHAKHIQEDAVSAIKATTAMRYALMYYNKYAEIFTNEHANEPLAKYKPHIRIGSGLNSGRATVGFMGSYDKMEFTSIGDAVNLASRTESSNKPCGTDMLITEDTYNLLKMDYIRCEENQYKIQEENLKNEIIVEVIPVTFEVKGKGKQHFYGVVNMPNFDIEEFFKTTDPDFVVDEDCRKAIGPTGPKTLKEVRTLLGIPTPDFGGVNLDAEENKVTVS